MSVEKKMQEHLDNLTKPRGSLGKLESYAMKVAVIQGKVPPEIGKKGIYVFSGDHGIAAEGVSLYPQEVTRQMLVNILGGGAGINSLAAGTGFEINVVDAGTVGDDFSQDVAAIKKPAAAFIGAKMGQGSRNCYHEDAMTASETKAAIEKGRELSVDAAKKNYYITAIGDLGIANTSTAAALLVAAGFDAADVVDKGTGIDSAMLEHKREVVAEAVKRRAPKKTGEAILAALGSFDFAMMAGLVLGLEGRGIACVLDGFPVSAAAYMAYLINPKVTDYLFAGHLSKVAGHRHLLDKKGLEPVVSLDLHLGEGTGAVIGGHIVELGVLASRNMATFASAQVSGVDIKEEKY
jgi:nicotinate-nucleotide--dimethylbenzimidazole phosphoribosyltransferase